MNLGEKKHFWFMILRISNKFTDFKFLNKYTYLNDIISFELPYRKAKKIELLIFSTLIVDCTQ